MKFTRLIVPLLMLTMIAQAAPVTLSTATTTALNWYTHQAPLAVNRADIGITDLSTFTSDEAVDCYIFTFAPGGFVVVSGNDATVPVIGYSFESTATAQIDNPALLEFFDNIQQQLQWVRSEGIDNSATLPLWREIMDEQLPPVDRDRDVSPLLSTTWDQGCNYNADCPADNSGPCNHVWAGCVATAMGQVMKYWAHPAQGEGSHSYTHPDYGYQYANFGATTYNWASMPNSSGESDIAELLYHLGVSVEMDYSPDGSGAYTSDCVYALENYFDYNTAASYIQKSYYSNITWENMMRGQLDDGQPMTYRGSGTGGHAFVLDGYQGSNYFHFNWGWSGYYNGYFYLNDLTPGSYSFTSSQAAIINVYPNAVNTAPVVGNIPDQLHVPEGTAFATITLDNYVVDSESSDSQISWSYSGNVELSVSIINRVATITAPDDDWFGLETITFRATDPGGLWDEDPAIFWMESVNDPPVVANIPNQYLTEGDSFADINLNDYVTDDDTADEYITWTYHGETELLVTIDGGIATIDTPDSDWAGLETITFVAMDNWGLTDEDLATFWMQEVNDAPVVADIPDEEITGGDNFTQINLDDYVSDVDHLDSQISWMTEGETDFSIEIDPTSHLVTISYPEYWEGSETVTFTAWDGGGLSDSDDATFTVIGLVIPDPVDDLNITVEGNDVVLEWSAVTGAVEYNIYRLAGPFDPTGTDVGTTDGTAYTLTGELMTVDDGFYIVRVVY